MKARHWRAGLLAVTVLILVAVLGVAMASPRRVAPTYEGKTLNRWLDDTPAMISYVSLSKGLPPDGPLCRATGVNTTEALHAMGPEALPILLAKLNTPDSSLKSKYNEWVVKVFPKLRFESPLMERTRAAIGLQKLMPLPEYARRRLQELRGSKYPEIAATAKGIQETTNPYGVIAVTVFER